METTKPVDLSFDLQNMIKVSDEPVTKYYKFIKKLGAGTYG